MYLKATYWEIEVIFNKTHFTEETIKGRAMIDELIKLLEDRDLEVKRQKGVVMATHQSLPITLIITLREKNRTAKISIEPGDELSDVLADLIESGEDVEILVDDVLSEIRDVAIEAGQLLEKMGYKVEWALREGENDVRDALEDVLEEYEFEEEE